VGFGSTLPTKQMQAESFDANFVKKYISGSQLSAGLSANVASFELFYPFEVFPSQFLTDFSGFQIRPFIRLDQSLLKDLGENGQTQSGIRKVKSSMAAARYMQLFSKQQVMLKARAAYLSLSLAREVVSFRQASLERSKKLVEWTQKRFDLDLVDRSDLLQAQAGYKLRQLNLQAAVQDEVAARQDFNELLGTEGAVVNYDLEKIADLLAANSSTENLVRSGRRADVLAASENLEASRFAQKEAKLRTGSELGAFGMASLNGLDLSVSDALKQVTDASKPTYTLGVNYTVPLGFSNASKVRKGYELDVQSSLESLAKAEISAENDWTELNKNWAYVRSQLALSTDIKNIQEARVNQEQQKFQRGRTTTFNVLNAENDLDDAMLNVYRLSISELIYASQVELYNTQPFR
jgi:outer membrane protein TolC